MCVFLLVLPFIFLCSSAANVSPSARTARGANGRKGPMVLSALSNGVSGRYNFVFLLSVYSLYTIPSDTVVIQMSQGMTIEVRKTNIVPRKRNTSLVQTDELEDRSPVNNEEVDRDDTHMDEVKAFFKEAGAGRRRDKDDDDMETASAPPQ